MKTEQTQTFTEWLSSYPRQTTRKAYHTSTRSFLQTLYQTKDPPEVLAPRYIAEVKAGTRDYLRDLVAYINVQKERPPLTLRVYVTAISQFALFCLDIDLSTKDRRMLRQRLPKGNRPRTKEVDLTRDIIRKILHHSDVRTRALILFLVSSGIRIGEALKLRLNDVTLDAVPPVVYVRGETAKEGDYYISFISSEAKEALQEWVKQRESYMADAARRTAECISHSRGRYHVPRTKESLPSEDTLFPFSYMSANVAIRRALKAAGLYSKDPRTKIGSIHPHCFRKFFLSQIKTKIPSEVAEALVGHQGYLSNAYRRYPTQQLAEFYCKGESALLIFQDTKELETANAKVDERTKQNSDLMAANQSLIATNLVLQERMSRWDAFFTRHFKKDFEGIVEEMGKVEASHLEAQKQAEQDYAEYLQTIAEPPQQEPTPVKVVVPKSKQRAK